MHLLPPLGAFMIKGSQINMAVAELTKGLDKEFSNDMVSKLKLAVMSVLTYAYDFDFIPLVERVKSVKEYLDSMQDSPAELQHECILALATLRQETGVDLVSLPVCHEMTKLGMPLYISFMNIIGAMCMVWLDERNGVSEKPSRVKLRVLSTH